MGFLRKKSVKTRSLNIPAVVALCLISTTGLTSCQSSCTGDPRFDNYWCARGNLNDGTYARQTANLRAIAADRQLEAASLRSQYEARRSALAAARANNASNAEIRQLEREVASLQAQINALRR